VSLFSTMLNTQSDSLIHELCRLKSSIIACRRHEELLAKGGLYSDMWMKQQQVQDSDSASDSETKDRKSEKLQPQTSTTGTGPKGH